jgi:PAS domain S-box-containing protein
VKKSRRFLQDIVEHIGEPVFVFDARDYRMILANRAAAALVGDAGRSDDSVKCHQIFYRRPHPCEEVPERKCPIRLVASAGVTVEARHDFLDLLGRKKTAEVVASPIPCEMGEVRRVIVAVRDATEKEKSETVSRERAHALEEAISLKELLTDILGHDLLSPATVIRCCADRLEEGETDPGRLAAWGMLQKNLSWLVQIVQNTARYSGLAKVDELDFQDMDTQRIFREVVDRLNHGCREKGLVVEFRPSGECIAPVNPMIEEVFLNVFSNAVKFSPEGGRIVIDIRDEETRWVYSVRDSGPGIPDEGREQIFNRFERLDKVFVKGQGLGLAISKKIMELHGGRIWAENAPEKGAVLFIEIEKARRSLPWRKKLYLADAPFETPSRS